MEFMGRDIFPQLFSMEEFKFYFIKICNLTQCQNECCQTPLLIGEASKAYCRSSISILYCSLVEFKREDILGEDSTMIS